MELPALPTIPPGLLAELRRDPSYTLETLALAAVDVHGKAAQEWMRERGPLRYSQEQLAKSATKRFANTARVEGAALGFGGIFTAGPDTIALVWILTREVLFVAAAYGHDPTDKARAAEMLVIFDIYDTIEEAQAGLDHQGERLAAALARKEISTRLSGGHHQRSMTERLVRYSSRRIARRYGGRLVPGLGSILGAIDNAAAARRTGDRAIAFYKSGGNPKVLPPLRKGR
ncbi:MAG: EcsC family protein [Solirubrobacteraceae bacterium]|nr:EcsC family protein [Solirubrobacteraceae bacterium]